MVRPLIYSLISLLVSTFVIHMKAPSQNGEPWEMRIVSSDTIPMPRDTVPDLVTIYLVDYHFSDSTNSGYQVYQTVITGDPDSPFLDQWIYQLSYEVKDTMIHPLSVRDATGDEIAEQFLFGARVFADHYYTTGDTSRKIKSSYFFKDLEAIGDRQIRGNLDGHTVWIEGLHCLEDFNFPVHGVPARR